MPLRRTRPEPGREPRPRPCRVERRTGTGGVGHERVLPPRRLAQCQAQFGGAQRWEVGRQRADARARPAGGGEDRAVPQRRVQPPARLVAGHQGTQAGQHPRGRHVVGHRDHPVHHRAGQRGRDGIRGHRQRQLRPVRPGEDGEAGFGVGKYLDGNHQ